MSELLSCPFCGSTYTQARYMGLPVDRGFEQGWRGECCECGALTRACATEAGAIKVWNTRAVESANGLAYISLFRDNGEFPEHIWASLGGETIAYFPERTCHNVSDDPCWYECSSCRCTCSIDYWGDGIGSPNYCPMCGAQVKRGDE